jgi:hypothetical protein
MRHSNLDRRENKAIMSVQILCGLGQREENIWWFQTVREALGDVEC